MWDCDIESYNWFRRFESRYFADDFFTDFEEMQEEFEDAFMDIDDQGPRELMGDYQTLKDVGVREFSSFVYRYSMTIGYNEKPRIRKIRNEGVGSGGSKREVHKYNRPHITTSEKESLAEVNIHDKEVKVVLEMPGASKDNIRIKAYENSVEILSDHPQRRYQVIKIPQVADIKTIRSTYKNGILEIVFNKKEKPKLNNKRREIKIE
jgi:HSP20 family protein